MGSTACNPFRVRFVGPLAPHAAELAHEFSRLGYSVTSAVIVVRFAAHLSRWLASEEIELSAVTDAVIDRLEERGVNMIKTTKDSGQRGRIPENIVIDDTDFEEIQEGMLIKGLVHTTFDDFAGEHGLTQTQDEI